VENVKEETQTSEKPKPEKIVKPIKAAKAEKRKYSVPAVETTFKILTLLSRKRFHESTITEIANALSLSPATCFRILQLLEDLSIVRYEKKNRRYTLGPYLVVLGERAKEHLNYLSISLPYLEMITKKTGFTSVLVNRVGEDKVTFIAKVEGADFGVNVSIGRHFSITDGSYGKCFLAYMDQKDREYYLTNSEGLRTLSEQELTQLEHEFEEIKIDGYGKSYGEYIKGIFSVAAPVFSDSSTIEMSISLLGMTAQIKEAELDSYGLMIKDAAAEITREIRGF
jgi:DNA-binding IclR family transcriptional regulator